MKMHPENLRVRSGKMGDSVKSCCVVVGWGTPSPLPSLLFPFTLWDSVGAERGKLYLQNGIYIKQNKNKTISKLRGPEPTQSYVCLCWDGRGSCVAIRGGGLSPIKKKSFHICARDSCMHACCTGQPCPLVSPALSAQRIREVKSIFPAKAVLALGTL